MVKNKGQFKIQQMAFMLLGVVLFFGLVAMFFFSIQARNLSSMATELERNKAILMTSFISGATEFSCAGEQYCIDTDKLLVFSNNSMYKEFWPVAYIKVRKISPISTDRECNKANYPDCNIYNIYENKKIESSGSPIGSFVSLCRYEKVGKYPTRICDLGKMIVGYKTQ